MKRLLTMIINENTNYWLYIAPHVYCNIKDTQVLLYNTKTGTYMHVIDDEIINLIKSLHDRKNLGVVSCTGITLANPSYSVFVSEFCEKGMGNIEDISKVSDKPIQMMPILNVQRDVDKLQKENERDIGEEVLRYLLELNIYLNNSCELDCSYCNNYSKQTLCCHRCPGKYNQILSISSLEDILRQIKYGAVGKLNLSGGNIFKYPYYKELIELLLSFSGKVHFWIHYQNFISPRKLMPDFTYDIIITFPLNNTVLEHIYKQLRNGQACYHFLIINYDEYIEAERVIDKYGIESYSIHPIYVKTNFDFFLKNVYLNHDDIFQTTLSLRKIFTHQKLNSYFFGSFTILANGNVYANMNCPMLGNIVKNNLLDLIKRELLINTAWRRIRDAKPCSDCLYQYLCPSISNYEIIMNKPNLCHIKQ